MNCSIIGSNVRSLARTVNFFSKIGNELYLEALPTGLSLKVINSVSTAYAVANFNTKYFVHFSQGTNQLFEENNCKVSMKPILKIFKNISKILICKIWLNVQRMKIIFQFECKSCVRKTHTISLLEYERIRPMRLPEVFPMKIVGDHKTFARILAHIHRSVREVTLEAKTNEVIVSNFIENVETDRTTLRSSLSISSSAFTLYDLESPSDVTFCYKEFKAMTYYATQNRINVEMNFDQPGAPIMMRMKKSDVITLHFIMGTMRPKMETQKRSVQRANRKLTVDPRVDRNATTDSERIDTCNTLSNKDDDRTQMSEIDEDISSLERRKRTVPNRISTTLEGSFFTGINVPHRTSSTIVDIEATDPSNTTNSKDDDRTQMPELETRNSRLRENVSAKRGSLAPPIKMVSSLPEARRSEIAPRSISKDMEAEFTTNNSGTGGALEQYPTDFQPVRSHQPDSYDIILVGNTEDPNSESQDHPVTHSNKRRLLPQSLPRSTHSTKRPNLMSIDSETLFTNDQLPTDRISIPETLESQEAIAERKRKQEKIRHIFRKCFEDTVDPQSLITDSQVFAENSDPEN